MLTLELLLTVISAMLCLIDSYPSGAPSSSCINLLPNHHGTASQPLPAPYTISINRDTYSPRTPLIVFGKPAFMAFLIQGQRKDTGDPAGEFVRLPANTKYLRCSNEQDSVTHSNPTPRNISQFVWNPPLDDVGEIVFKGTVARTKSFYYGGLESKSIKYVPGSSELFNL
ncbi:hypothetical protein LOTGIDRAFT_237149 [Lottia gigantea]|uniref:Reelin domain-containing protein n=1 Tax=Lottia gigantea TaxID=225164 RepID=V3ZDF0_LOTGI|nr:hypothetical protein LOTGIDRAFT_237149 [Lottia gigantea]ESO82057.1 hypothetical protein LOTGIDRAFT_237149 [Lottia gigantea]